MVNSSTDAGSKCQRSRALRTAYASWPSTPTRFPGMVCPSQKMQKSTIPKFAHGKIGSIFPSTSGIRSTTPSARTSAFPRTTWVAFSHSNVASNPPSTRRAETAVAGVKYPTVASCLRTAAIWASSSLWPEIPSGNPGMLSSAGA